MDLPEGTVQVSHGTSVLTSSNPSKMRLSCTDIQTLAAMPFQSALTE